MEELSSMFRRGHEQIPKAFLSFYDCGDYIYTPKNAEAAIIRKPAVVLLAGTTISFLQEANKFGIFGDGLSSRMIWSYDNTIRTAIDPATRPEDLARPGHIFPLRAREGGVLVRAGQTEASVDLSKLAGLAPAAVICEIMDDDGTMARMPSLIAFGERHGIPIISVADLIAYRRHHEQLVRKVVEVPMPTASGDFVAHAYLDTITGEEHVALVKGDLRNAMGPVLVRMHSKCLTGDTFGSLRCDCGQQLQWAMDRIETAGTGVVVYLHQEGRGIGLHNKLRAYVLQDQGADTIDANLRLGFPEDKRDYGIGAQILADLGVTQMVLMTNNPKKLVAIEGYGLEVTDQLPIPVHANPHNIRYLETKRDRMGHLATFTFPDATTAG
ncbi:MAG: GTP cyclohydrolase II [Proteobacteria bacterium]|nr:GTP cyclohydrolase II [Pseudomonadota bacterium]